MNYINQHDFYLETNGKIIDVDGVYGGQCWDLFAYYTNKLCRKTFPCIETGYVIDLWNTFDRIGLNEYFEKVIDNYQDGDWLVWQAPATITTSSHIAMFRKDNGDGTNVILTQNPNGNPNYTYQMVCNYQGVIGALRPKIYITKDPILSPEPVLQNSEFNQVLVKANDTVYCRTSPDNTIENKTDDYFIKIGYYDVLDEIENKGYHWYKIGESRWIAQVDGYIEYIPKEENKNSKKFYNILKIISVKIGKIINIVISKILSYFEK